MSDLYNLIIHSDPDFWNTKEGYVDFPKHRFLEYTVEEVSTKFSKLTDDIQSNLLDLPALFAIEKEQAVTRVGKINKLGIHQRILRIYFEFDKGYRSIPKGDLKSLQDSLDIDASEFTRTHWAIKNVSLFPQLDRFKIASQNQGSVLESHPIEFRKDGTIKTKESTTIEFKQNFSKEDIKPYLKTIMSFANNQGGSIIFGVKDNPRKLVGLDSPEIEAFNSLDEADISKTIDNYCSETISIEKGEATQGGKQYCYLKIKKAQRKPIICIKDCQGSQQNTSKKKSAHSICDGDIYFRSSGRSEKIKHRELKKIIEEEREKERKIFIDLMSKIATIGAGNIHLLSTVDGGIDINGKVLTLDEKLIKQLNFIKSGEFVEKKGAPAYVIKGEIEGIQRARDVIEKNIDPNQSHPNEGRSNFLKKFQDEFKINERVNFRGKEFTLKHIFSTLFVKEKDIENDSKLFWSNSKGTDKKYADKLLHVFKEYIDENQDAN